MSTTNIIPRPTRVVPGSGALKLNAGATIGAPHADHVAALLLAQYLRPPTGWELPILVGVGTIRLVRDESRLAALGVEGYELQCTSDGVCIVAASDAGLLWGVQTLRQLLPAAMETGTAVSGIDWVVPSVHIVDQPRFCWRGGHLDVSRHFFDVTFVKRFIDLLALHKQNVFHWHLTDDHGWRLQINRYPELTRAGASYTQAEAREVVAFAAARGIQVLPEIELPGHALAVLAAYPQFACTEGPFHVATEWGVFEDVFCVGSDDTLTFLRDVFDEVLEIFPGRFIHVGGDECPKARWQLCSKCRARRVREDLADEDALQAWTIRQFDKYLADRGRRLVGWDEILDGGLAQGATVMSWRGVQGGLQAARAGHDVVMSPQTHVYLDRKHYEGEDEPGRLSVNSLENCYRFDPTIADMTTSEAQHVLGVQANVWSEGFDTPAGAEVMTWPRMSAVAEIGWTAQADREFADFTRRFRHLAKRLDTMGVSYYRDRAIWG